MGWFKKKSTLKRGADEEEVAYTPCLEGEQGKAEAANSQQMAKDRKERDSKEEAEDGQKVVVEGAKIKCDLCSNPLGTLKVNYDTPTTGGKKTATVKEKDKTSLLFTGTCSKSPNSSSACAAVMQLAKWENKASIQFQDEYALLLKSKIKCLYGGVDLKFVHCGQMKTPFLYDMRSSSRNDDPEDRVDVALSVFFDGTQNNRRNTEARENWERQKKGEKLAPDEAYSARAYEASGLAFHPVEHSLFKDDSYENDYSNVAKLFRYAKHDIKSEDLKSKVYIEGIGTTDLSKDSIHDPWNLTKGGVVTGEGTTGIIAKVKKGCEEVAKKISSVNKSQKKIGLLSINVFGFSRGAAAARHFVYEINKKGSKASSSQAYMVGKPESQTVHFEEVPPNGELGKWLKHYHVEYDRLRIRFAGLFDTVSSHGSDFTDDTNELHLDAISKARHVLHLVAADEHRENFALTNTRSANGKELWFPGVHSDVGGGYTDQCIEKKDEIFNGYLGEVKDQRQYLISEGWYEHEQLEVNRMSKEEIEAEMAGNVWNEPLQTLGKVPLFKLSGKRVLSNNYSLIPLHLMCEYALEYYVSFDLDKLKDKFSIEDNSILKKVKKRLHDYIFNDAPPLSFIPRKPLEFEIEKFRGYPNLAQVPPLPKDATSVKKWSLLLEEPIEKSALETALPPKGFEQLGEFEGDPDLKQKLEDHNLLLELRNRYLHWSSDNDWFGMDPHYNRASGKRQRTIYNG